MTSRASSNISLQSIAATRQLPAGASSQHGASQQALNDETQLDSQDVVQQPELMIVSVGQRMQTRTMLQNQGAGAISIARSEWDVGLPPRKVENVAPDLQNDV